MSINLTPQFESRIQRKVESGYYDNASEVVMEAVRLMAERDRRAAWERAIAVGEENFVRSEGREWTADSLEHMKREAMEEARQGIPISPDVQP